MKTIKYLSICIFLIASVQINAQTNWYVKTTGTIDGNAGIGWNSPTTLDNALAHAVEGDVIHVAEGTYIPQTRLTNGRDDKEKCFEIKSNIAVIGGYAADASDGSNPNPQLYKTILSGKLDISTNAYHVVVITAAAIRNKMVKLSGLTISDGVATSSRRTTVNNIIYLQNVGGGLVAEGGVLDLVDCTITNNTANKGAGCWVENAVLNMQNTKIQNNAATVGQTGGVYLYTVTFNFDKVFITGNTSETDAGGLYAYASNGSVNNSCFSNNQAKGNAGGIQITNSSTIYLYNSAVNGNSATGLTSVAGGIYNSTGSYLQIGNCTVFGNSALSDIGAVGLYNQSRLDVISSTFTKNTGNNALGTGGIWSDATCKTNLYNTILSGNIQDLGFATDAPENVVIKKQSIVGEKFFDRAGLLVSGVLFTPMNMLDSIRENGGVTPTCKLLNLSSNVAILQGITSAEMFAFAGRYALPGFIISTDQREVSRPTDKIALGAYQDNDKIPDVKTDFWHLIMYGQSLSAGYQSYPSLSVEPVPNNYMIGNNVCVNYNNQNFTQLGPLFASPTPYDIEAQFAKNTLDAAKCENPVIGAANHIQRKLTNKISILASSCGTGGKTIEQLSKINQRAPFYYDDFLKTIQSGADIAAQNKYNISCPAFFWMQGEQNYTPGYPGLMTAIDNTIDKDVYKSLLLQLKNDMQTDVMQRYSQTQKPVFITYQVGQKYIKGFEQAIAMAQLEASNVEPDIVCAGPVSMMTSRNNGHLDPNGYRWFGEMLGKVFYKTVVLKEEFMPLQPKKITRIDDKTLQIDYLVPVKPLIIDTLTVKSEKDYGFGIKDNGLIKNISSIKLTENGESVIIKCTDAFVGAIEVNYAGQDVGGHGNLRDSDPYQAFSPYVDLDAKDTEGKFIYERDANVSTLHPDYEPRDADGVIYGKPYPLFNYSLHFYYKLPVGITEMIPASLLVNPNVINTPFIVNDVRLILLSGNNLKITGNWNYANIYDLSGKICMKTGYTDIINVNKLTSGIYLVDIFSNNKKASCKFIR